MDVNYKQKYLKATSSHLSVYQLAFFHFWDLKINLKLSNLWDTVTLCRISLQDHVSKAADTVLYFVKLHKTSEMGLPMYNHIFNALNF